MIFLTWWATPVVLIGFWFRYLPRHDWGTWWHITLFTFTSFYALWFYKWAKKTFPSNLSRNKADTFTLCLIIFFNLSLIGILHPNFERKYFRNANFYQKDVSYKPDNWNHNKSTQDVKGAELQDSDLHFTFVPEAFLVKAKLHRSNLNKVNFRNTNLKEANLYLANLNEAILTKAQLQNTNFRRSKLTKAKLERANLINANLEEANLEGANLTKANLKGADLTNADLTEVNLSGVNLRDALLAGINYKKTWILTCNQLLNTYINMKTQLPDYLKITGDAKGEIIYKNKKIEILTDYQCEEIEKTVSKKKK